MHAASSKVVQRPSQEHSAIADERQAEGLKKVHLWMTLENVDH